VVTSLKDIPVVIESGRKYETTQGFKAIKNGVPVSRVREASATTFDHNRNVF
jgi:hypothetical protein